MWTGHRPHIAPCWHSEWGVFRNAIIYEEFSIWSLMQAIEQTDNQALIGAYSLLLVESSDHLRLFASLNPEGSYDPLFLSQETWDGIMAGTFPESTGDSFAINPGLNDAWYYPGTDGQGFFISVFPSLGTVSLAWFTFDTELPDEADTANLGAPGQRWLIATGPYQGDKATLDVVSVSGGLFDTSSSVPVEEVIGSVTLQFEDCNSGSISYEFPGISRSAEIPIERVAIDNVAVCLAY